MTHPLTGRKQTSAHIARRKAAYPKERKLVSMVDKIISKIELDENGCWVWKGSVFKKPTGNYGQLRSGRTNDNKLLRAHRVSYETFIEIIPQSFVVDHLCGNTLCVYPDHLEAVPQTVNMSRGRHATKTSCVNGHDYLPDNLFINSKGRRECLVCRRLSRAGTARRRSN